MLFPYTVLPLSLLYARSAIGDNSTAQSATRRPDRGPDNGSVWIKNSCDYDVYVRSVGAWETDNNRNNVQFTISAGSTYHEFYREVCPKPNEHAQIIPPPNCPGLGKMEGEGIVFKISRTKEGPENFFQLEYALTENPERGDNFLRLDYDISLLNCNQTANITEKQAAASTELNQVKIDGCPGYQGGMVLWFDDNKLCRPIYCDGKTYCDAVYNYEPTIPTGEDSMACDAEYYGNMYFEMCVGNVDGTALSAYLEWASTGTSLSSPPEATATNVDNPEPWTEQNPTDTSTADDNNNKNTNIPYISRTRSPPTGTVDETTTTTTTLHSTTTVHSTVTISRPRITSSPPTATASKTYPTSCTYDTSASTEVCWSQLPPKTGESTVTVTKTITSVTTMEITKTTTFTSCPSDVAGAGAGMSMSMSMSRRGNSSMGASYSSPPPVSGSTRETGTVSPTPCSE